MKAVQRNTGRQIGIITIVACFLAGQVFATGKITGKIVDQTEPLLAVQQEQTFILRGNQKPLQSQQYQITGERNSLLWQWSTSHH